MSIFSCIDGGKMSNENVFAEGIKNYNTSFVIKNKSNKYISIFNNKLKPNSTLDLLTIPGISETEIKASLLKGVLSRKIKSGELEVLSNTSDIINSSIIKPALNVSELSLISLLNVDEHSLVYVKSVRDYFQLNKSSSLSVDNITVLLASDGVSKWIRKNIRDISWSLQSNWYIDPVSGNDNNTGDTLNSAIKTWAEFMRRVVSINIGMTLTITSSLSEPLRGTFETSSSSAYLKIIFIPTILASGSASTFVDPTSSARGTTTVTDLTLSAGGVGDFSNFVGKLLRAEGNADGYRYAQIFKAAAPTVANVGFWTRYLSNTKPTNGALVEVIDLPTVPTVDIVTLGGLPVEVQGCDILGGNTNPGDVPIINPLRSQQGVRTGVGTILLSSFNGCIFRSAFHGSQTWFLGCLVASGSGINILPMNGSTASFIGGGSLQNINLTAPGVIALQGFTLQGAQLTIGAFNFSANTAGVGVAVNGLTGSLPICVYDSPGDGVYVRNGAQFNVSTLWGSGNTGYGVQVDNGGFMRATGTPIITGTAGDVRLDLSTTAIPPLTAGATVPAASNLTTWAQWAASPFNRNVISYTTGSRIIGL